MIGYQDRIDRMVFLFLRSQSEAIPPFDLRYSIFDILQFAFIKSIPAHPE